ncbi:MAG TPA: V-type ATPase subunit [Candidatus Jeotgalibaca merdavium]|uniref:V-type ATPase subunit n=1 Tax=Candidatus Jeotgalibaca merdavium TaxID=2838627 RepID=A0A9D2I1Q1_9LACT|nr:V-type ATPase subunit [Candidatus Jeotgalibaca merdavium]
MIKDIDYKAINTLIRTYELKLLQKDDFERLLKADDLKATLDTLKATDYEFDQEELLQTKQFNEMLMAHLADVYRELYEVAPQPQLLDLFTLRYSYHNLKVLLKDLFLESNRETLLIPIGSLSVDQLKTLASSGESDNAHPLMVEAVRLAKEDFDERQLIEAVTVYMDTYYLRHLRAISDDLQNDDISAITDTLIDLYNLTTLVRSLNQGKPRSHLHALLSSSGTVSKQDLIDDSINGAVSVLKKYYSSKVYGSKLEVVIEDNKINTLKLDKIMDELISEIVSEGIYQAFGPMPLLGYIYAKETEITNLRLLLVGKDNQIDETILRERMRTIYGA